MKILFVLEYYHPHIGGVERLFKQLVDRLINEGHQVKVLTNRYHKDLPSIENNNNLTIKRYRFYNRYFFTFLAGWAVWREAKYFEIIHTTSYNAALPAYLAAKFRGTKSLITFHEYWGDLWLKLPWISPIASRAYQLFEKLIINLGFDRFVAVSDFTANALKEAGLPPEKITHIYNGIDYSQYTIRQKDNSIKRPFQFCFFGRASFSKGLDVLLKAFQILIFENCDATLTLILPKEDYGPSSIVLNLVKEYGVANHIIILHELSEEQLKMKIQESDAVVIPSYSEGFCFAAVETMALGVPIVSSGMGALAEVINGTYIHSMSIDPVLLADTMKLAMSGKWKSNNKRLYPIEETVEQYIKVYYELLQS